MEYCNHFEIILAIIFEIFVVTYFERSSFKRIGENVYVFLEGCFFIVFVCVKFDFYRSRFLYNRKIVVL